MRDPTAVVRSGKRIAIAESPMESKCFKSRPHWVVLPHRSTPSKTIKAPRRGEDAIEVGEGIIVVADRGRGSMRRRMNWFEGSKEVMMRQRQRRCDAPVLRRELLARREIFWAGRIQMCSFGVLVVPLRSRIRNISSCVWHTVLSLTVTVATTKLKTTTTDKIFATASHHGLSTSQIHPFHQPHHLLLWSEASIRGWRWLHDN
jgi:hypothetical protein